MSDADTPKADSKEEKPAVEEPSIDELLKEYSSTTEQPKQPDKPPSELREVVDYVRDQKAKDERDSFDEGVQNAVDTVLKAAGIEEPSDFDKTVVEGILYAKANKRQDLSQAFHQRGENPDGWNKILAALGKEFADARSHDSQVTADVEAAKNAVQGSTSTAPEKKMPTAAELESMDLQQVNALAKEHMSG